MQKPTQAETASVGDDLGARAHADGCFMIEPLIDERRCGLLAERLQEYAGAVRQTPQGMTLQQEPAVTRTGETLPAGRDVRKIDGLYHDEIFRSLIEDDKITTPLRLLLGSELRLYRATALMKPASVGSAKGLHQDAPYWPIEPMSMWSCWIPLDDATVANGCLTVIPGSHLDGPLAHHATDDDFVVGRDAYDANQVVAVPAERGSGIFFHSLLLHGSAANTSGLPRRAVTLSYMGSHHRCTDRAPLRRFPLIAPASTRQSASSIAKPIARRAAV